MKIEIDTENMNCECGEIVLNLLRRRFNIKSVVDGKYYILDTAFSIKTERQDYLFLTHMFDPAESKREGKNDNT